MRRSTRATLSLGLVACLLHVAGARGASQPAQPLSSLAARAGDIPLRLGLPADAATVQRIYDELDRQRASQAYLWALPLVSFAEWQHASRSVFGAGDTDMVIYDSLRDKLGIITANATTPYIGGFPDLAATGPLVIDYPAGATAGGVGDFWQRPLTDMGETGPDRGQGGKYLVVGPNQTVPAAAGYRLVTSPANNVFVAFRVLDPDPAKAAAVLGRFKMYPLGSIGDPPPMRYLRPEGRPWSQVQPRGLAYWERLAEVIQREPVEERDRIIMAMLRPLGIEKGRPFQPDERQRAILQEGARLGELMAQALSFDSRLEGVRYRADSRWEYVINFDPSQEAADYSQLDERTNWFYQAVTTTKGMTTKVPGAGQAYLGAYHDRDGHWLDGGKAYRLRVPANPPAKLFWSVTVYDALQRVLIDNGRDIADRSSRQDLARNADGSVDLYMGPSEPEGLARNWIPTVPGKAWFAYLRLYGPLEPYFERSWKLPDIEPVP